MTDSPESARPAKDEITATIALLNSSGIGVMKSRGLIETFGSATAVFAAQPHEIYNRTNVSMQLAQSLLSSGKAFATAEKIVSRCEELGIALLTPADDRYPARLKTIPDRPPALYALGVSSPLYDYSIAMVGSRSPSDYTVRIAPKIAGDLASAGVTVVSGMAVGVDTLAHHGALQGGGRTIAVLGNGLDIVYPPSNKKLFERIIQSGWVISEYPPGTKPEPHHFPARNRIISGLSIGVVIVEAGAKSGALITAHQAVEYGRELMALPGVADSLKTAGNNRLIKEGTAVMVECAQEILDHLKSWLAPVRNIRATVALPSMTAEEAAIYRMLEPGPQLIDNLIRVSGMTATGFNRALTAMQLKGVVQKLPGARVGRR